MIKMKICDVISSSRFSVFLYKYALGTKTQALKTFFTLPQQTRL